MSETIPDDILSAAVAVVDRGYDTGLIDAVAAALLAERERCAKIAEQTAQNADDFAAKHFDRPSLDFQRWSEGCRQVAAAIRMEV